MKQTITILFACFIGIAASAQFVARMEVKEDIPGLCDKNEVYAIFPMVKGQEEAVGPMTEKEIEKKINNEVQFLKDNPTYEDKGMVGLIVSCKGELVQCRMSNKTKSEELDNKILAIFATLLKWEPAKINKRKVDSSLLFSFTVKDGKLVF